ncbi:hypothetical protein KM043_006221 [Ampulex compressa]|nr:hypothetical protein KM043_006221 [Ampulex compressa]
MARNDYEIFTGERSALSASVFPALISVGLSRRPMPRVKGSEARSGCSKGKREKRRSGAHPAVKRRPLEVSPLASMDGMEQPQAVGRKATHGPCHKDRWKTGNRYGALAK